MTCALLLLALLGHVFFWVGMVNRLHALAFKRRTIAGVTRVYLVCMALLPVGVGWWLLKSDRGTDGVGILVWSYLGLCGIALLATLARWALFRYLYRRPPIVRSWRRRPVRVDLGAAARNAEETRHHPFVRLPLNEILRLEVTEWGLEVPRLAPKLDGLSIVHLTDLHMTGRVGKAYFREVVRVSNELRPDLAVITGDIIEEPDCLPWLTDTLGQLTARHGVYFILGNHDWRIDYEQIRRTLVQSGLVDMGGRRKEIRIGDEPVILVGNERPWLNGAEHENGRTRETHPPGIEGQWGVSRTLRPLHIALAHTPDQFGWARALGADVLLAGHTHGGQICIPPLGPIVSPSTRGVKFVAGIYHLPPTILHVSRGVSGDIPIRWNCPPEIAHIRLHSPRATGVSP